MSDRPDRAARWTRVRELATVTGLVAFGALLVVNSRSSGVVLGLGVWIIAVGVLLQIGRVLRDRELRGTGRRGRIATRTLDGEPATVLHESPVRHVLGAAFSALAAAPFVALVLGTAPWRADADPDQVIGVVVILAALLVPVSIVVSSQLRRALRAGVWLTPTALVVRERDIVSRVRWADIRWVPDEHDAAAMVWVMVWDGSAVGVVARRRQDRKWRAELRDIPIRTGMLALGAPELVALLRACQEPAVAARLGSDAGLALVRGARRFEPVIAP
ncbi:hypothetical protein [Cellulomonas pakistanensis]|uniref:Uncharacterized protein n=1 Tax=Cellulomonas pakistanensis TaxID=992287 RepID=A0A919U6S4_9CELL|nr:hypothetical protein [Cellulomonas pakistanensis]GIG36312.1 hypothetical protein Cpa01nite_16930 [Cellulomonas pakistanensis]